jgi:Uma2 family endonuclease
MATATHLTIEEYLHTTYEPDADYVDGEIEERNVGEYDHNAVQLAITLWFHTYSKEWSIRSVQEQRTRLSATRVRIPDVGVFPRSLPIEQVFTQPQLITIEVLSPDDRHGRVQAKINDYMAFGVRNIFHKIKDLDVNIKILYV